MRDAGPDWFVHEYYRANVGVLGHSNLGALDTPQIPY